VTSFKKSVVTLLYILTLSEKEMNPLVFIFDLWSHIENAQYDLLNYRKVRVYGV